MKKLKVFDVALITYFNVCGGPWGVEKVVAPLGPFVGITSLVVFPILYCIPIIKMTSDLSSKFPENGGYSIWVQKAFGDFWGFQESYWSFTSGVIDNALYPGFVYQLSEPFIGVRPPFERYIIKLSIAWLFALPTLYHISSFMRIMRYSAMVVLIPFFLFCVLACFRDYKPERLLEMVPVKLDSVQSLLMVLYWNYGGFDSASTFSNEIVDIDYSMKRGLFFALVATILTYCLPIIMGVMVTTNWSVWGSDPGDCSWSCVVTQIGGPYMGYAIIFSSTIGAFGLYMAELFEDSWQLCGMSEAKLIPKCFSTRHSVYGTPIGASMFSIFCISILVYFDFTENLLLNNFFCAASILLEIAAHIHFKGFHVIMIPPLMVTLYVLYIGFDMVTVCAILFGVIIYPKWANINCNEKPYTKDEVTIKKVKVVEI